MAEDAPLLLDATRLIWRRWSCRHPTGIDRVCLAYLERFGSVAQAVVHHRRFRKILSRRASAALFEILREPPDRFRAAFAKVIARELYRPGGAGNGRLYLNIGHTGLDSDGFRNWVSRADVKPIYFVHDLIPITHPQYCRAGESERHRCRMRTVLATATGVIGNSRATLDELAEFARSEGASAPPSVPAWLGTPDLAPPAGMSGAAVRPSFVVLGTIEARKNHALLLDIWSKLVRELGDRAPQLIIAGQRGWEADDVFRKLDGDPALKGHVVERNDCTDAEVARYLAQARALLFPSKAEGYGLPLVEALAVGTPVIASDLPVFREIGQGIPALLDPADEGAWTAAIVDFAQPESSARAAQIRKLAAFRPPTWDEHFRAVEHWLATLDPHRAGQAAS